MSASTGRHRLHTGHLVVGVALVGLVTVWALLTSGAVSPADLRWLAPVPWLVAGTVGLVAATVRGGARGRARHQAPGTLGGSSPDETGTPDPTDPTRPIQEQR